MPHAHSAKIFSAALIAVLGLSLMTGGSRLIAQENPAPVAQTSAQKAGEPAKGEAEKPSQEEQEHGFLVNGPIVKAISGATGWSRDTTATVFLWFNFAIIFFGIAIPLGRALPKIMRKRRETLSASLDEARKATTDANARLSAVEAKLAGLDQEIAKYRAQVEEESKSDETRIKASIDEEKTRIVASTEQELNAAAAQARRSLRSFAADLAVAQATQQLTLSPEADHALIAEFAAKAAEGGKN